MSMHNYAYVPVLSSLITCFQYIHAVRIVPLFIYVYVHLHTCMYVLLYT